MTWQFSVAVKQGTGALPAGNDPLVIDLDRDGLELTRQSNGVYFDNDVDQFAEKTAWVKSDDGILVRDINGNGLIDNQGEMFGTATTSGFAALKTYADLNNDNIINATDANFASLRVWRDLNQNGVTDAGELQTLAASGRRATGAGMMRRALNSRWTPFADSNNYFLATA